MKRPPLSARKTLRDIDADRLRGAVVALRADFNVPLDAGGVADATRIERTVPTIDYLVAAGSRVVILSHLGCPGGRVRSELTLSPVADCLGGLVEAPVAFLPHTAGDTVRDAVAGMVRGSVLLLENTRFLPGETEGDPSLAAEWARWADHFVLEGFGTAHRAHASTDGLPRAVRRKGGEAVAGFLVAEELEVLGGVLNDPGRPFAAVIGGAKISGKIDVIEALLPRVDVLMVGGAMANTFFLAMGMETGTSFVEPHKAAVARRILEAAGPRLLLPVDCVVAASLAPGVETRCVDRTAVTTEDVIGDVGPVTADLFQAGLSDASTIVWNGPMGVFEIDAFAGGTHAVSVGAAAAGEAGATVIIGGGDSVAAVRSAGVENLVTHISTGGGASLDLLAGKALPGLEALSGRAGAGDSRGTEA
ncbi:MAG: phosphoglycerate kinase [Gemmatimonadetes bacterium]|nr:phosphoglycerate kinase [Gemmatimonadota bacterium]MYE70446.1 phosphoglycerate kinase [Gemmatimonadota bacterium]MYJ67441.1 phosphoglycerate kinase [Gemmatimonadota bacterium]